MTDPSHQEPSRSPDPNFPTQPEFYRRVLQYLPTALVVVDATGRILYANRAMLGLGGWAFDATTELEIINYVHPDDKDDLAVAFLDIVDSPEARIFGGGQWAEIYFRITTADGSSLPVELIGAGGLMDDVVGGLIYEVRPARTRNLLGRVLDGLSQGASMHHLLSLVAEMISSPPLDLEAVILQSAPDGTMLVAAETSPTLSDILRSHSSDMPWHVAAKTPELIDIQSLPDAVRRRVTEARYLDMWHVAVESPLTANTLRIVATSPTHHIPVNGPRNRLLRARELAAAVLLRSQSDVLLDYAAAHDLLTGLPNRAAFYQQTEGINPLAERAAIHLDLDGMKPINANHGPATGDAVLQVIADRLQSTCAELDIIGRVGDDEFTIMVDSTPAAESMTDRTVELAQQIFSAVSEPIVVAGRPLSITASIGIAFASSGISTDHLLTWADAAMHDAKQRGGGQICRYGVSFS